jgi:hypothetical protein
MAVSEHEMEQRNNVGGVLAREVAFRISEFRRFFMDRVHEINDMTAREVMGAVTNISAVVEGASSHIRRVKQMLTSVDGGQGQMGVADAIAKQSKALKQFLESVSRDIGRQEAVAARAQEQFVPRSICSASPRRRATRRSSPARPSCSR